MPKFREVSFDGKMPVEPSNKEFTWHALLYALICFGAIAFSSTTSVFAQETPKPQTQTGASSAGQTPNAPSSIPGVDMYNLLQKKSLFFPNIATSTERLSTGGKFKLFVNDSISLHTISWAVLSAAIGQADNSPTGYEQGWDAYAKRFGASMGTQASMNFFGEFVLASALHQDPRFYPEIKPSFGQAVKYSVQRVFVTRNDDGKDVANWSGLVAPLMAEGLANVYYPDRNRTVGDTFLRYGWDLATRAGGNMFREYWPTVWGKVHHEPKLTAGRN
jgi:hypothetical protein